MGKADWTPAEVQALGWSGIQRFHGVVPEDALAAIERNTHHVSLPGLRGEVAKAPSSYRAALGLTKPEEANVLRIVGEENGVLRDVHFGPSATGDLVVPSMELQVLGSPNQINRIAERLGREYQQMDVRTFRPGVQSSTPGRFAIEVEAPEFTNMSAVRRFWDELRAGANKTAKHLNDFVPYSYRDTSGETRYGIRIVTGSKSAKREVIEGGLRRPGSP